MKKINLNQASIEELNNLESIGSAKAKNIISYREKVGGFEKKSDLLSVKGIGSKILAKIKDQITVGQEVEIVFDPQKYMLDEVNEVHLVGEMTSWNPGDKTYALEKNEQGIWQGKFNLPVGTEYKIMYDSDNWEAGKYIGDGPENLIIK